MRALLLCLILSCMISCVRENNRWGSYTQAYVPIYAQSIALEAPAVEAARPTQKAGKIYAWGTFIYQNEEYAGIHIIDNSQPGHPVKRAFLKIPYNTDFAVRGGYVYANSFRDLVVINIMDPDHPVVEKRIKDAFPLVDQDYPPSNGPFVCVDHSKGIVVGWELKTVEKASCRK